jgi:hypothetical protein
MRITELEVGSFYGEDDNLPLTRAYLKKYGVLWSEERGAENELLRFHLTFPEGTKYEDLQYAERAERHRIELKETENAKEPGVVYWWTRKDSGVHGISVPYMIL